MAAEIPGCARLLKPLTTATGSKKTGEGASKMPVEVTTPIKRPIKTMPFRPRRLCKGFMRQICATTLLSVDNARNGATVCKVMPNLSFTYRNKTAAPPCPKAPPSKASMMRNLYCGCANSFSIPRSCCPIDCRGVPGKLASRPVSTPGRGEPGRQIAATSTIALRASTTIAALCGFRNMAKSGATMPSSVITAPNLAKTMLRFSGRVRSMIQRVYVSTGFSSALTSAEMIT
mmetsp:Transcript_60922/g.199467  ORF Transcript_60922/g.199467 Transcript_60922/m.199467 type:complete len:231 (-) Transcript_60922:657-1349(-)